MPDTELHYITYDPDAIWADMLKAYQDAGGGALYAGDEKEILLRGVQKMFVLAFAGMDNALRMDTLRYAVREYLDIYGEKRGCTRLEAAAATAELTLTAAETGEETTLAAGTAFTSDGQTQYLLDEDVTLSGEAETLTVSVTCAAAGAAGNALTAGTPLQLLTNSAAVQAVTCSVSASGGRNAETDDSYRERIRTYGLTSVTTGPKESYEALAEAVSTDVVDAKARNGGDGKVSVYILPASGANVNTLISSVQAALSADNSRPLTDEVSVSAGVKKAYSLKVTVEKASGTAIDESAVIAEYQAWQDTELGRAFNPDYLLALFYQAGATRAALSADSAFDGGDAVYTEISESEYCSGSVEVV